ncbi:ABC transporter permease [Asanoa sp. NPDC050611]|uniref:ABC transporter permease n=1 Tax=Asanoa sp. NPDC050611 TaxID=3157098 RepID=UPI0033C78C61
MTVTELRVEVGQRPPRSHAPLARVAQHTLVVAAFLVLWQVASGRWVDPLLITDPISVGKQLWEWIEDGRLVFHLSFTLQALLIGFVAGSVAAFLLAVVFTELPRLGRFAETYIIAFNAIPNIALVPIFIVWFGFGIATKILMAYLTASFIVFIAAFQGLRNTDARYLELARILEASRWQVLVKIRLWAALPFLASAFKMALPKTALAVVIAEFLGSNRGVGYLVVRASNLLDIPALFAAVVVLTALVQVLSLVAAFVEARLLRWIPKEKR